MSFKKLEQIKGGIVGCANCGYKPDYADMNMRIAVGLGMAVLTKDGQVVYGAMDDWEDCMTVAEAEELAAADPDHDWRIHLLGPLSEVMYQRHDVGKWVLVKKGLGFA
jgi:hypothetical protein